MFLRLGLLVMAFLFLPLFVTSTEARREEKKDTLAVMFGGTPGRNLANTVEKNIPGDWSIQKGKAKNVQWQEAIGGTSYGGPIVAEGKIFVGTSNERPRNPKDKGDKGVMMCFDEKTGKFLWQITHNKLAMDIDAPKCGIASTPAIEDGKLYYVANSCELVCASTANGKILWSLDMIKQLGVYPGGISGGMANCSPLVIDDLVIVGTSNGVDSKIQAPKNPKAPSLIAVNKTTGKVVWQDASPGNDIMDGQWSSPAAAKVEGKWQVIYGGGDGWLRGFDAKTGELVWKFDCNPKGLKFNPSVKDSKNYIVATPVVHDGKVYIANGMEPDSGTGIGHLWCIDITKKPANKALDLSPVGNDFDPKSPKNAGSGLVWHHGGAIVPKPAGNARVYHFSRTVSTVAVHDGLLYVAEVSGFLQCLDAKTGEKLWEEDLKDGTWSSPYYVDGKVFIGVDNGDLYVFQAGKAMKPPTVINMEQMIRTPPVAANGVLYVTNGLYLYAIK
jgi:outer membrane protein assembly factor BamB